MNAIDADGFEEMFRQNIDPWNYAHSAFEAYKRTVLLRGCASRFYGRVLELACANGETTRFLAPRCLRLLAVDASVTALAEAARRTAGVPRIAFRHARLPEGIPKGAFDLIVVSEILYYLKANAAATLLKRLRRSLAPGGRIVVLHHILDFDDAAQLPKQAQENARIFFGSTMRRTFGYRSGRFDAMAFVRRSTPLRRGALLRVNQGVLRTRH